MELKQSQGMQNIEQTANQEFGDGANKTMGETARKGLVRSVLLYDGFTCVLCGDAAW